MEQLELSKSVVLNNSVISTKFGINSDQTGYGKTLSMIGLIIRDQMKWDLKDPYVNNSQETFSMGKIQITKTETYQKINTSLIICDASLVKQWVDEISRYTDLNVLELMSMKNVEEIPTNYDIIVVNSSIYNNLYTKTAKYAWKRVVCDEPHMYKSQMNCPISNFYWIVTATPALSMKRINKKNFITEFFNISPLIVSSYDLISKITIKNTQEFIDLSIKLPVIVHKSYKCHQPLYTAVKGLIKDDIAEMISAGNIIGAIKELGGTYTDNIIDLIRIKTKEEINDINLIIQIYMNHNNISKVEEFKNKRVLVMSKMKLLEDNYDKMICGVCSICFEKIKNPMMETNCQNLFCCECLLKWVNINNTCPLCRTAINDIRTLIYIKSENDSQQEEMLSAVPKKTKNEHLIEIIKSKPEGKFIIFSSWNETFITIRNILEEYNISYAEIKGSISAKLRNIENFKNGKTSVIFLNNYHNACGINLQEATDIILYHKISDYSIYSQIMGRANRIGRTDSLFCHCLD